MQSTLDQSNALLITRNLPPLVGGMERLIWHIAHELRTQYHVHVIGPMGCSALLPADITVTEVPLTPIAWYLVRTKLAAARQALCLRPAFVFAGSGLTAPFAWLAARLAGAQCIVYLHGLDIDSSHWAYRLLWLPFLRRCDKVLVNSRFTGQLARNARIAPDRIAILHPGVTMPDMQNATRLRFSFRKRHALGNSPVMLYVGRITARKGLALFVREILPTIMEQLPDAKLVVIGDEPRSALLKSQGELAQVQEALETSGLSRHVTFLGERIYDDPELDAAYFAADTLIFPVQQRANDNEGFGMVAIEAAAHGLPTVAFAAGGVTDAIEDRVSGTLIRSGDNLAFAHATIKLLKSHNSAQSEACRRFSSSFAWTFFGQQLRQLVSSKQ